MSRSRQGIDAFEPKHLGFLLDRLSKRSRRDLERAGRRARVRRTLRPADRLVVPVVVDRCRTEERTGDRPRSHSRHDQAGAGPVRRDARAARLRRRARRTRPTRRPDHLPDDAGRPGRPDSNELWRPSTDEWSDDRRARRWATCPCGHAGAGCRLGRRRTELAAVRWTGVDGPGDLAERDPGTVRAGCPAGDRDDVAVLEEATRSSRRRG